MISKGFDVIVEDMVFFGIMRFKIKFQIFFFYIDCVEMCFFERFIIDYVCKFFGGDNFGFDINFILGLESFIFEQIYGNFVLMMYVFKVFFIEVVKMFVGMFVDQVVGVVVIIFYGVQGFKNIDKFGGFMDVYVVLFFNRCQEFVWIKVISDNFNF